MNKEIALDAGGKVYTLAVGTNTLRALEQQFSTPDRRVTYQEVIAHANRNSMTHITGIVWAMLRKHHRDMTMDAVGDLIDEVGLAVIDARLTEAVIEMIPDAADLQALGITPPNPQKAQPLKAVTGGRSTRKRAASA